MIRCILLATTLALLSVPAVYSQNVCLKDNEHLQYDSFACICDETYCDYPGTIVAPATPNMYVRVISDQKEYRFEQKIGTTEDTFTGNGDDVLVHVKYDEEYQEMYGFGGAFTDSTGLNVLKLPLAAQDHFVKSYFAPEGIQYDVCRIPIAGSDFSTRPYTYDDTWMDVNLTQFALEPEDYQYKLPLIKRAMEVSDRTILLFGSPWAPPAWMKTNEMLNGTGGLKDDMWDPFSNYLIKFVQAYENEGLPIWGLTPTNEPLVGNSNWAWNACYWNQTDQRDWIATSFGPIKEAAGYGDIKLMVLDHNRDLTPDFPNTIFENKIANNYSHGTAVHWYGDDVSSTSALDRLHSNFPNKFIMYTESCEGWRDNSVHIGDWQRAENYAHSIMENSNAFSTGWIDWNMALDMSGGPNWANNHVDSPILVDEENSRFLKQPMFYAMGHFSKFVQPGSIKVYSGVGGYNYWAVEANIYKNLDGTTAIVLLNKDNNTHAVSVETDVGTYINVEMTPKSLETILIQTS